MDSSVVNVHQYQPEALSLRVKMMVSSVQNSPVLLDTFSQSVWSTAVPCGIERSRQYGPTHTYTSLLLLLRSADDMVNRHHIHLKIDDQAQVYTGSDRPVHRVFLPSEIPVQDVGPSISCQPRCRADLPVANLRVSHE